jgi:cytochrome P450
MQSRDPKIEHKSVFNLDTGAEWQIRRNILKRPFAQSNLRKFKTVIASAGERVCAKLEKAAESGQQVEIDMIFGQMAVEVICEVGFGFKLDALTDRAGFQVIG